jgi:hypothetical protein
MNKPKRKKPIAMDDAAFIRELKRVTQRALLKRAALMGQFNDEIDTTKVDIMRKSLAFYLEAFVPERGREDAVR